MKMLSFLLFLLITMVACETENQATSKKVSTGAQVLLNEYLQELKNKKVGLLLNSASRVDGVHLLDTLLQAGVNVTSLFAAEHGFRGEAGAGEVIIDGRDQETGLPVYSLYGKTKKPTPEMLEKVDVIIFDLPDVGLRFYTYSSTMGLVLEAAAENDKEVWILDRPNPLGGDYVAGWLLEDEYSSFVGAYPLPMAHGLTMGEIAQMAIGEQWLAFTEEPKLKVINMKGWKREMMWPETNLEWIAPSPNLPTFEHAFAYTGTVIFEGTNISEGRGTEDPFLTIGSPDLTFTQKELNELATEHNVQLDSVSFTPKSLPGKAISPKYEGEECFGIKISIKNNYDEVDPVKLGIALLKFTKNHSPNFEMKEYVNYLYGINIKSMIENNETIPTWEKEVQAFKTKRQKYLLY